MPAGEMSYVLEDWLQRMCVKEAFRESVQSLVDLLGTRVKVSVDTAEEHARQMDQHFCSFRDSQLPPPAAEEGELLVAISDGKGVPMRRTAEPGAAPVHKHRRGKGQKANKKQMAYVGAVYSIDRSTGDINWKLGGTHTPESLEVKNDPNGDYPLGGQHDV